jgi:ADP-heptose:LPS heptosyltransferase
MRKILIYNSGGGLGDSIQLFPLIISLQNHFQHADFYYLGAHSNHFLGKLKEFNLKIKTLNLNLRYFGFRWWHLLFVKKRINQQECKKFDLIIDLQSKVRNSIILKRIPHEHFYSTTLNNFFSTKKINTNSKDHLNNLSTFLEKKIKFCDFDINQLSEEILGEADKLLPNNNYVGFSITQGNAYRKKGWPDEKFISLAIEISKKNKIPVFFIEKDKTALIEKIKKKISSAIIPEVNSSLACPALVTALARKLDLAISIDNGVMHMMGLAKIPMVVLFGPTNASKFAPTYNDIKVLDSKKLYNSKNLDKISIEDVLKYFKY